MTLKSIRERKASKVAEARAIVAKAEAENRQLTNDEGKSFDTLKSEITDLETQEARAQFLDDAERRQVGTIIAGSGDRQYEQLQQRVSLLKVIRARVEGEALTGAEAEYHAEAERRTGRKAQGIFVPMAAIEQRVNTTTTAGDLVGTVHRPDLYIAPLRNRLLARQLGVRVLSGLQGNISIPKYGTGLSVGWVAENQAVPESNFAPDSITLTPKHAGGVTELSRQLIMQASPDVEQLVRDDFAFLIAQAIDSAMIVGGGPNEPVGVLNTTGVQTASLSPVTWGKILAMKEQAAIVNANAANWVLSTTAATAFAGTEKSAGTGIYLAGDDGRIAGLPSYSSNQVPDTTSGGTAILGDWSQVMLGIWSELDILVNPYEGTAYRRGGVLVRAMATVDVGVRHPEAFVVADDVTGA